MTAVLPGHEADCPECKQRKHGNCTHWALDEDDNEVPCACEEGGHA